MDVLRVVLFACNVIAFVAYFVLWVESRRVLHFVIWGLNLLAIALRIWAWIAGRP